MGGLFGTLFGNKVRGRETSLLELLGVQHPKGHWRFTLWEYTGMFVPQKVPTLLLNKAGFCRAFGELGILLGGGHIDIPCSRTP